MNDGGLGWRVVNCTGVDGVSKPREPHWFTAATWNWYHRNISLRYMNSLLYDQI